MLAGFICPDKGRISVEDCLSKCRMGERCLTSATLLSVSADRVFDGRPSTTMLINGTMYEFLKLTQPFWIEPESRAFMLEGTKHHKGLEEAAKELGLPAEIPLSVDRDIFDVMEIEDNQVVLTDYKLYGSYKVASILGLQKTGTMVDPSGAVYKTTTKYGKAGESKRIPVFTISEEAQDRQDLEYQLNNYRIKLEELGIKVDRLQIQATVRDGGTMIALSRGITRRIYRIPIRILDNSLVEQYFHTKADNLAKALENNSWSIPCDDHESWSGRRCVDYCEVADYCSKGKLLKQVGIDNAE